VKLRDKFWAKGQPYSLTDMLHNETLAIPFVGGTVYQAFLSASSYHRWQSPVSGIVRQAYNIEGTYFSAPLFESLDHTNVSSVDAVEKTTVDDARGYISAMATRSVIIIEADNPKVGLVAFVAIGMEEISSCEITVEVGRHVKKGDDTGTFHYGGSSYAIIFEQGVELVDFPTPKNDSLAPNLPVGAKLARIKSSTKGSD
jgi:phosphatidylserine decarboxylase